jgi:hypothetical protein
MHAKKRYTVRADLHLLVQGAKNFGANPRLELVEDAALFEHLAQSWEDDPKRANARPHIREK